METCLDRSAVWVSVCCESSGVTARLRGSARISGWLHSQQCLHSTRNMGFKSRQVAIYIPEFNVKAGTRCFLPLSHSCHSTELRFPRLYTLARTAPRYRYGIGILSMVMVRYRVPFLSIFTLQMVKLGLRLRTIRPLHSFFYYWIAGSQSLYKVIHRANLPSLVPKSKACTRPNIGLVPMWPRQPYVWERV